MDEDQIASEIAKRVKPAEPMKPEVAPIVNELAKQMASPLPGIDTLNSLRLTDFFAIPQEDILLQDMQDKLGFIYNWAAGETGSDDSIDVLTKLRELEGHLGLTFRTGDKLEGIYRWIKLDGQRRRIEKEMGLI